MLGQTKLSLGCKISVLDRTILSGVKVVQEISNGARVNGSGVEFTWSELVMYLRRHLNWQRPGKLTVALSRVQCSDIDYVLGLMGGENGFPELVSVIVELVAGGWDEERIRQSLISAGEMQKKPLAEELDKNWDPLVARAKEGLAQMNKKLLTAEGLAHSLIATIELQTRG